MTCLVERLWRLVADVVIPPRAVRCVPRASLRWQDMVAILRQQHTPGITYEEALRASTLEWLGSDVRRALYVTLTDDDVAADIAWATTAGVEELLERFWTHG